MRGQKSGQTIVVDGGSDGKKTVGARVQSDFGSGLRSAAHCVATSRQSSNAVILDLDEVGCAGFGYFCRDALPRILFFVEVQSDSELRGSVDAVVAPVCVITLWTSPPCSLASCFSVTGAVR